MSAPLCPRCQGVGRVPGLTPEEAGASDDTARLDWLATHGATCASYPNGFAVWDGARDAWGDIHPTLRAAIDAARSSLSAPLPSDPDSLRHETTETTEP